MQNLEPHLRVAGVIFQGLAEFLERPAVYKKDCPRYGYMAIPTLV